MKMGWKMKILYSIVRREKNDSENSLLSELDTKGCKNKKCFVFYIVYVVCCVRQQLKGEVTYFC